MGFIIIGLIIYAAVELAKGCRERARQREILRIKAEQRREAQERNAMAKREIEMKREQERIAKETARLAKEQERQAAQLAKHEKRIADLEHKMEQAEVAIMNEQTRLDHYTAKLSALDEEIAKIDRDIEYYQLANKVDAENKARVARAKVEDKIFSFEEKVRACETRMFKAQHTIDMAKKEIEAA